MQLEFRYLSQAVGDDKYANAVSCGTLVYTTVDTAPNVLPDLLLVTSHDWTRRLDIIGSFNKNLVDRVRSGQKVFDIS